MEEAGLPPSLVETAYDRILSAMLDRETGRTEALTVVSMAQRLGMSRTPVRLALSRLESEGLLVRSSPRGWTRVRIRLHDIDEIFDMKQALDPLLARRAAERCTPEDGAELRALITQMGGIAASGDIAAWTELQTQYHSVLLRLADNQRLADTLRRLNNQLHHLSAGYAAIRGRMDASVIEHKAAAEAIIAGDGETAGRLAFEHLQRMRNSIVDVVKNVLIAFVGEDM